MTGKSGGSAFACDGVDLIAIREGLVDRKDTYVDLIAYQRQGLTRFDVRNSLASPSSAPISQGRPIGDG